MLWQCRWGNNRTPVVRTQEAFISLCVSDVNVDDQKLPPPLPPTPIGGARKHDQCGRRRVSPSDCLCIYFCTVCEVCVRSGSFKHCVRI